METCCDLNSVLCVGLFCYFGIALLLLYFELLLAPVASLLTISNLYVVKHLLAYQPNNCLFCLCFRLRLALL